jgi:hypothetical protein
MSLFSTHLKFENSAEEFRPHGTLSALVKFLSALFINIVSHQHNWYIWNSDKTLLRLALRHMNHGLLTCVGGSLSAVTSTLGEQLVRSIMMHELTWWPQPKNSHCQLPIIEIKRTVHIYLYDRWCRRARGPATRHDVMHACRCPWPPVRRFHYSLAWSRNNGVLAIAKALYLLLEMRATYICPTGWPGVTEPPNYLIMMAHKYPSLP